MKKVRIFDYVEELDCFVVNPIYKSIAKILGLTEWNEVVWIGRYFTLDNDYGEHWFDNWELREKLERKAEVHGLNSEQLFILDSERFRNNSDGPCHTDVERKSFWTDVLKYLMLSIDTLANEARKQNEKRKMIGIDDYISDLEKRIEYVRNLP